MRLATFNLKIDLTPPPAVSIEAGSAVLHYALERLDTDLVRPEE